MNSLEWNNLSLLCCRFNNTLDRRTAFIITARPIISTLFLFFWFLHLPLLLLTPDCGRSLPRCTRPCKSYCRNVHPWLRFLLSVKVAVTPTCSGCVCTSTRRPCTSPHSCSCRPVKTSTENKRHSRTWECSPLQSLWRSPLWWQPVRLVERWGRRLES